MIGRYCGRNGWGRVGRAFGRRSTVLLVAVATIVGVAVGGIAVGVADGIGVLVNGGVFVGNGVNVGTGVLVGAGVGCSTGCQ